MSLGEERLARLEEIRYEHDTHECAATGDCELRNEMWLVSLVDALLRDRDALAARVKALENGLRELVAMGHVADWIASAIEKLLTSPSGARTVSRNDNHLCGLTLYAETCSLKEGHAGACADGTSERPALLRDRDALAARSQWLQEVVDALKDWSTYFDLRGALCEACMPKEPLSMIAAQDKVADALDNLAYFDEAALASPNGGGA